MTMRKYVLSFIVLVGLIWPADVVHSAPIGPFEIRNPDSTSRIRLQFAGQLRARFESHDGGAGSDRTEKLSAEARRIRVMFQGDFPRHRLTFKLHLSFSPGSLELMDMQFDYRWYKSNHIRIGQYKIPFTRYRIQSFQRLTFVDWAIVTRFFGAERQMGVSLHNGYEIPPTWAYEIGLFAGQNARASHAVGLAGIYGEPTPNPSDLADPGPKAEFHPAIFAHLSYNPGGIFVQSDSDDKNGGLRGSAGVSAGWDFDPNPYQNLTGRFATEALAKYRGASLAGIGYIGLADVYPNQVTRIGMTGGLFQGAYRFKKQYEVAARYAIVDFTYDLTSGAYSRAMRLIAYAQNEFDISGSPLAQQHLDDVKAQYKDAGRVVREEEITIGFNVYLEGHSLKWQNDGSRLVHRRHDGDRIDYIVRSQLQLAF
jgi:hypothetical protein